MKKFALIATSVVMLVSAFQPISAATGSWPMAGGTADRRHFSSAGIAPPLKFAWDTNKEGSVYAVPPLIAGNYCYLGMAKMPVADKWEMEIQKRSLDTGDMVWKLEGGWWVWNIYGSDLIVQGYSPKTGSWVKRINSFDKSPVWEIEWSRTTVHSVIEDDIIYTLSYTDWKEDEKQKEVSERIFFFQAISAENGRMLWRRKFSYPKTYYPPWFCVWGDGVYGGIFSDLYKLEKSSGSLKWQVDLKEKIAQGSYIVGTDKGILCNTINDNLRLFKHDDGSIIWTKKLSTYVSDDADCESPGSSPAIMSGKIYILARGAYKTGEPKKMLCLDLGTGRTVWEAVMQDTSKMEHSDIGHTCTVSANGVYSMTEDASGKLTKLRVHDPESGVLLWSDVASGMPNPSELAVNSEYMILGLETRDEHGKGIFSYACYTSKGAPKPKLEIDATDFDLGYINTKTPINKIIKIRNSGSGELQGSVTANVPWITITPPQFQGNNETIVLSVKPESLSIGPNKGTVTVSSSGGKKTVEILVTYGGGQEPKTSKEALMVKCSEMVGWSKKLTLKGFHHGIVSVSVPWLLVSPLSFEDNDPTIMISVDPDAIHRTSVFTGKVTITTNLVIMTVEVTVTGVSPQINILMQLNNTNASVNGQFMRVDPPPAIIKGSTFVPLRFVGDAFGVVMNYDSKTKEITYKTPKGAQVRLQINNTKAYINGKEVKVSPPPSIVKGKTLVPIRFIGDSFGATVNYNSSTKSISVEVQGCP